MLDLSMFAEGAQWQEIVTVTGSKGRLEARIPGAHLAEDKTTLKAELSYADRATHSETTRQIISDPKILAAGSHHGSTYYQHQKFAAMIREGGTPEVSLEDGLWSVRVGEAAGLSAKTGQPVAL
jgi:predicted dehydrogenase